MDRRLLSYYDRELAYLRELGSEFAEEFPKVAGKLGLSATDCADPHVERLLEGFAFLTARVQLSMDAEFPRFTEHLLDMIYPHCLAPTPSMAVVSLQPNPRQVISRQGFTLPRGTTLRADIPNRTAAACRYRTAHDVTLWPIELSGLSHESGNGALEPSALRSLERGGRSVRSLLRLRLRSLDGQPFSDLQIDRLPLFIRGQDALGRRLFELCHTAALGVAIRRVGGSLLELRTSDCVGPLGFEDDQALLPHGARSFQGYRLLQEYFALPDRFAFVELRNLASGIARCSDSEVELLILLDRHDPELEAGLGIGHAQLFCTPVVNLFEHRADRIQLSDRTNEYHVLPDRTRPGDFEVHSVVSVTGHGEKGELPRPFQPFYACTARTMDLADAGYFTLHRRPRPAPASSRSAGSRGGYPGSDTYLALVDGNEGPYRPSLRQLSVEVLCSNRDLPLSLCNEGRAVHFQLDISSPVLSARAVAGPSAPQPSRAWRGTGWQLVSHLSSNYLSPTGEPGSDGAPALRELLQLYADLSAPAISKQIQGVRSVTHSPIVRRLPVPGPASFGRGLEVSVHCDEPAFEGVSLLAFGMVLDRFFARYASINSFTEVVLRGSARGEIARFGARLGRRRGA